MNINKKWTLKWFSNNNKLLKESSLFTGSYFLSLRSEIISLKLMELHQADSKETLLIFHIETVQRTFKNDYHIIQRNFVLNNLKNSSVLFATLSVNY